MDMIPLPKSNELYVVVGGRIAASQLLSLAARFSIHNPLLILDCGNKANPRELVNEICRLTNDPIQALYRIQTARAFTCYQTSTLLDRTVTQKNEYPIIIFDLLDTFYDENVTYHEGNELLKHSLQNISKLRQSVPVVISIRPSSDERQERTSFLKMVCDQADHLWIQEKPQVIQSKQLSFNL
jgi:hypothetical protein